MSPGITPTPSPRSRALKPSVFNALRNNQRHKPWRTKNHPHNALTRRHGEGARTATEAAFGGGRAGRPGRRVSFGDVSGWSRGRFTPCDEALALEAGGFASRHGLKSPMRSGEQPTLRPSGADFGSGLRPRAPMAHRKTATRSARLRRNGTHYKNYTGRGPGASHPSHSLSGGPREAAKPCLPKDPLSRSATAPPEGEHLRRAPRQQILPLWGRGIAYGFLIRTGF